MKAGVSAIALALAALAACASVPPAGVPLTGEWGGTHVGLRLSESGGLLDYDCAAGTIDGPLLPRADGTFEAQGRHTPGTGGPERVGEVRASYPTHYRGAVRGTRMTLQGEMENGVVLGPFNLERGAEPIILRCL
jgi:hypothetical protein